MATQIDILYTTSGQHEIIEIHGASVVEATDETLLKLADASEDPEEDRVLVRSPSGETAIIIRWERA